jgi:hypothetical protein
LTPFKNKVLPSTLLSEAEVKQAAKYAFELNWKFRLPEDLPQ